MFILMPCATVKDRIAFQSVSDICDNAVQLSKNRISVMKYSDPDFLIKQIQQGETIMMKKVQFDNYLKNQVELMRAHVQKSAACPFEYVGYMDSSNKITTAGMGTKQQWAIQMIMSRYNICSIYHAAAYSSLEHIFTNTVNSYDKKSKNSPEYVKHLQITFKYFNQGYQPLKRLGQVYDTLQLLLTPSSQNIIQIKKQAFLLVRDLVGCNLGYLKIQKYRVIGQYKACKQCAYAIHFFLKDMKRKIKTSNLSSKLHPDILSYVDVGQLFFLCLAYYFLLEEHQDLKNKQDYGFVKKEFQQMIVQNCVVAQQYLKTQKMIQNFPDKDNLDNAMFAYNLTKAIAQDVRKKQYAYGINIHENKSKTPGIDQVITKRISPRNIWESINQF